MTEGAELEDVAVDVAARDGVFRCIFDSFDSTELAEGVLAERDVLECVRGRGEGFSGEARRSRAEASWVMRSRVAFMS